MLGLRISIFCFEHTFLWVRYSGLEVFIGILFIYLFIYHFQGRFFGATSSSVGFGNLDVGNSARIFTSFLFCCYEISSAWGTGVFTGAVILYLLFKKLDEKNVWMHIEPSRW